MSLARPRHRDSSAPLGLAFTGILALALIAPSVIGAVLEAPSAAAETPVVIVPPAPLSLPDPILPPGTAKIDGRVLVYLTLDAQGAVTEVAIQEGLGSPYDEACVAAAMTFTFAPATVDGEAVAVSQVPFEFTFSAPLKRGQHVYSRLPRRRLEPAPGYVYAGSVVEKGTRTPQGGVPVNLRDPRTGKMWEVLTEDDGSFVFYGLPPGRLEIDIFTGAFEPLKKKVRVVAVDEPAARGLSERFYLAPGGLSAYRTVVREKKPPNAATVIALTEDELTKVAGTFGDPTRVVASLPGVARSSFGLGYYSVRGAEFDNTGFFIDGHPAAFLYHLLGGPGVIYPQLVGAINFYPGGYPASFGRFAAGVIAIDTKDPERDRWHFTFEVDLLKAGILFSTPFDDGKGIVTLSFRRSYYELLLPLFTDDVSLDYTDYQVRVAYDFTNRVRGRIVLLGADDNAAAQVKGSAGATEADSGFGSSFHRINLALDVDLSRTTMFSNSIALELDSLRTQRQATGDSNLFADFNGWFIQNISKVTARPSKRFMVEGGLDFFYNQVSADFQVPSFNALGDPTPPVFTPVVQQSRLEAPYTSVAPYILADYEPIDGLRFLPGFRLNLDFYGDGLETTIDPKLAIRYAIDSHWLIKGMTALAHQAPNPFQVSAPFGEPTLTMTEAIQGSVGFEWTPHKDWYIGVEGFVQLLDGLPQPNEELVDDGDKVRRRLWNSEMRGRAYGIEVMLRKQFGGRFYGWISYTLARSERQKEAGGEWTLFDQDQTHNLSVAATVRLGNEWSLGARYQLTTGNPYYPVVDSVNDSDSDHYRPIFSKTRQRLGTYSKLDIRLDKTFRFDTWMLEVYLDVQNIFNQGNPESPAYSYDYTIRQDGASIPILPTIGIRAAF